MKVRFILFLGVFNFLVNNCFSQCNTGTCSQTGVATLTRADGLGTSQTISCGASDFLVCANTEYILTFAGLHRNDRIVESTASSFSKFQKTLGGLNNNSANTPVNGVRFIINTVSTTSIIINVASVERCRFNFKAFAVPDASITVNSVCAGEPFEFVGSCSGGTGVEQPCASTLTYEWSLGNAAFSVTNGPTSASSSNTYTSVNNYPPGNYSGFLKLTNGSIDGLTVGCSDLDTTTMEVRDTPSINNAVGSNGLIVGGGNAGLCVNGSETRSISVDVPAGNTYNPYEWYFSSGPINFSGGATASTIGPNRSNVRAVDINSSLTPGAYNWGVKITDNIGCVSRFESATPFYLNDVALPAISAMDASGTSIANGGKICEGEEINLDVDPCTTPTGSQAACTGSNLYAAYRWYAIGQSLADSITMNNNVINGTDTFTNTFSTTTSAASVQASMLGNLSGSPESNNVQYIVEVIGTNRCVATSSITLQTKIKPTIELWGDNTRQDTVTAPFNTCEGVAFEVWAQCGICPVANFVAGQSATPVSFNWVDSTGAAAISGGGGNRRLDEPTDVFPRGSYPYTVTYTGRNGCSADSTIRVAVLETPNPRLEVLDTTALNATYCANDIIKVQTVPPAAGYTYRYYRSIDGGPEVFLSSLDPTKPSFKKIAFNETQKSTAEVQYRVEVSAGSCSATADTTIEVAQSPVVSLSAAGAYCTDSTSNTVNIQPTVSGGTPFTAAGAEPYIYAWTFDGDTSVNTSANVAYADTITSWQSGALPEQQGFEISFIATDAVGCQSALNERVFDVDYCGEIILNKTKNSNGINAVDGRVCEGDTLNLEILGQADNESYSYEWNNVADSISTYSIIVDENTPDTIFTRIIVSRFRTDTVRYVCGQVPITTPIIAEPLDPIRVPIGPTPIPGGGGGGGGGIIQQQRTIVLNEPTINWTRQGLNQTYTNSTSNNSSNGLHQNTTLSNTNSFSSQSHYWRANQFNILPPLDPGTMSLNTGGFIYCNRIVSTLQIVRDDVDTSIVSRPGAVLYPSVDTAICLNQVIEAAVSCPGCEPDVTYQYGNLPAVITSDPDTLVRELYTIDRDTVLELTVRDGYECTDTLRRIITASPLPQLTMAGADRYCPTSSALIEAQALPSSSYSWSTTQTSSAISVNSDGRYYVTATLGLCSEQDSVDVQQYPLETPFIMDKTGLRITSSTYYICGSGGDTIYLDTTSCINCNVQWNTGETTEDLFVNTQGGYYINVLDSNGCTAVTPPLMVVQSTTGENSPILAAPAQICGGQSAVLEVPPCVGCQYEWFYKNTPGTYTKVDSVRALVTNTPGEYYAVVSNPDGCDFETQPFDILSNSIGIPDIFATSDSVCNGELVEIWTNFDSAYTYQWFKDGGIISGEIDTSFVTSDTGQYYVEVTYPNGCVETSRTWEIKKASFDPVATAPSTVICQGSSVIISTPLRPNWTYQWYKANGGLIAGATGSSYSAMLPGSYYVQVTTDYLCVKRTNIIALTSSAISQPIATTNTPNICFGDDQGQLSVSLCPGCSYQWYDNATGLALLDTIRPQYYRVDTVESVSSGVKQYYAEVHRDGCFERSNLVDINFNAVPTPAIFSPSGTPSVCNGRSAILATNGCVGCNYNWFKGGIPVIGGPNDTILTLSNTSDTGIYNIEITYSSGCVDTSGPTTVTNGGFPVTITSTNPNICNGASVTLSATPQNSQNVYTLFRGTGAVTGNIRQNSPNFVTNTPGVYRIEVENANGCRQLSLPVDIQGVNISPILTSRATEDPTSIDSVTAICGPDGRVFFEAKNCPGCDFQFEKIGTPNTVIQSMSPDNDVLSLAGAAGIGNYFVTGELQGCQANSNLIQINLLPPLNIATSFTDTSICNGSSIVLSYDSVALANCGTCGFRWLRDPVDTIGVPINGATNPRLTTTTAGNYALEITELTQGCVDTSLSIRVIEVNPPVGFGLQLDSLGSVNGNPGTPLAATGDSIDLDEWVVPAYAQAGSIDTMTTRVWFSSQPYNANLQDSAGLQGNIFNPDDSLAGFHLITYNFDTAGCVFTTSDVLEVLPPPGVDVVNINPASVAYEACVSDTLVITTNNLNYPVDSVEVYNQQGTYVGVIVDSISVDTNTFGGFTVYNTTMMVRIPPEAKESVFRLSNSTGAPGDTLLTAFVLIHNQDLQITGLPNMLCSNGTPIVLTGTPSGGTFFVEDSAGTILPTVMTRDTLDPTMLTASFYVDGVQDVDVVYSFTESYTNGNLCPQLDTTIVDIEAREVFLNQIIYNEIAVSQDSERLTNLVSRVFPQRAKAIRPSFDISFSGSFTNPAGNPTHFLPNNAGVGRHALTYIIENGDCINSVEDSITVIPAPTALTLPDTICSNHAPFTFGRDGRYTFQVNGPYFVDAGITSYTDTRNIMSVRSRVMDRGVGNPAIINQAIDTVTNATNLETYIYDVSQYADSVTHDTLIIQYRFLRSTDSLGTVDSLDYVIGEIHKPIFIETQNDTVQINRNVVDSIYCEQNNLRLLGGIPSTNLYGIGGYFTLEGGTGAYAMEDTLENNVLNPYLVHNIDSTIDVNYRLIYYLDGVVCRNSDTMNILIPERVNTDFFTSTGTDEFCDSDPAVLITSNIVAPDTAIWKIGGVPQSSYEFRPQPLSPGIHVVELEAIDIYGCRYTTKDTFTVHGLPDITFTPVIAGQYCTNDLAVPFTIDPSPYCPDFDSTSAQFLLNETFDSGIPATWTVYNERPGSKQWQPDAAAPYAGAGCVVVDTTQFNDTRTTLVTDTLQLIAGHNYKITFLAKVDEIDPGCSVGTCNAKMRVLMGRQNNLLFLNTVPADYPQLANDEAYVPFTVDFTPIATGPWFLGLQVYTEDWGRAIRVDELRMRDITAPACNTAGIGYMSGPGTTNILDSAYVFDPAAVSPGNHDVTYIYTNTKGCTDSVVQNITINPYPVVTMTDLDSFYCDNNPAQTLVGSPAGGQFSNLINGNLSDTLSPQFTPATYSPFYGGTDIVRYDYTDPATLCSSFIEDYVFVQQIVDTATFDIDGSGLGFCENEDSVFLTVTATSPLGETGTFYGHGVRRGNTGSGGALFYPDSAILDAGRTGDMELTYIFPTASGCADTTRRVVRVHANPDLSWMNLPDSICLNADSIRLFVLNRVVGGPLGNTITYDTLSGRGSFTTAPANFVGLFDILAPGRGNNHPDPYAQILYEYIDVTKGTQGCADRLEDSVRLDTVPVIRYQGVDPYYCENQDSTLVMIFPTYKAGSGFLQISEGGDTSTLGQSYYWIDPPSLVDTNLVTNQYNLYYTYEDTRGCIGEGSSSFEIRPFPRINFDTLAQDSFCQSDVLFNLMDRVPDSIDYGFFTDNLALTSIANDSMLNLAALPGPRLVTYNFTDSTTVCSNNDSFMVYVFNTPDLTFQTFGGCVGSDVTFDGEMLNANPSIDSITNITWDFGDGTIVNSPLDTTRTGVPLIQHQYGASNVYSAILNVTNQGLCITSDTQKVIISPSVDLANGDYEEDFQNTNGSWQDDQPIDGINTTQVWEYVNSLEGDVIKDSLNGAWVTAGNQTYGQGMTGWLYTPCFDFTQSDRPMIKMDMWRSMLDNVDGVVLEYYRKDSTDWVVVGDDNEGINWYQSNFVLARPGQQQNVTYPHGWTGESMMRSDNKAWEDPRFRLDQFCGKDDIRFRLAFASAPQTITGLGLEGVAVDNIFVGERTRNVLVEHFSNEQHKDAISSNMHYTDLSVYNQVFNAHNGLDIVLIQYQSGNAGYDINYALNTADADARVLTYGLSSENRFLLNGMRVTSSNLSSDMRQQDLDQAMLQFPKFDINIGTIIDNGGSVSVTADVTRLESLPSDSIDVHVVIIQDSLVMDSNNNEKLNVMRKMLPDNGGTEFSTISFPIGVARTVAPPAWDYTSMQNALSQNYPNAVDQVPGRLEAVVFVQNRRTKEIYQAATTQDLNRFINVDNIADAVGQEITDLKVYPNPAYSFFNVGFSQALEGEYNWQLIDVMGRVLKTGTAEQGIETFQVQADGLTTGTYFFIMQNDEVYVQRKVVIVR